MTPPTHAAPIPHAFSTSKFYDQFYDQLHNKNSSSFFHSTNKKFIRISLFSSCIIIFPLHNKRSPQYFWSLFAPRSNVCASVRARSKFRASVLARSNVYESVFFLYQRIKSPEKNRICISTRKTRHTCTSIRISRHICTSIRIIISLYVFE